MLFSERFLLKLAFIYLIILTWISFNQDFQCYLSHIYPSFCSFISLVIYYQYGLVDSHFLQSFIIYSYLKIFSCLNYPLASGSLFKIISVCFQDLPPFLKYFLIFWHNDILDSSFQPWNQLFLHKALIHLSREQYWPNLGVLIATWVSLLLGRLSKES